MSESRWVLMNHGLNNQLTKQQVVVATSATKLGESLRLEIAKNSDNPPRAAREILLYTSCNLENWVLGGAKPCSCKYS